MTAFPNLVSSTHVILNLPTSLSSQVGLAVGEPIIVDAPEFIQVHMVCWWSEARCGNKAQAGNF